MAAINLMAVRMRAAPKAKLAALDRSLKATSGLICRVWIENHSA